MSFRVGFDFGSSSGSDLNPLILSRFSGGERHVRETQEFGCRGAACGNFGLGRMLFGGEELYQAEARSAPGLIPTVHNTNAFSREPHFLLRDRDESAYNSGDIVDPTEGGPVLKSLKVKNFTVFRDIDLKFADGLNVIIGANGTGKTHLLKLPYAAMAMSAEQGRTRDEPPTKSLLQTRIAEKLSGVFRPEERLGRLVNRRVGRSKCEIDMGFSQPKTCLAFQFSSLAKSEVSITKVPAKWRNKPPAFFPTRELLTIYPGFVPLYETRHLEFDETWRDTCILLGAPALRGPRESKVAELIRPLEKQLGGQVVLDNNGRFYLRLGGADNMEMPLVAEGWRKLSMLMRLISTGSLLDKGCLFWDEPEANLNPSLIREIAMAILGVCKAGVQVFVATHSLFLLREFEILLEREFAGLERRYFALHRGENGIVVSQADEVEAIEPLLLLDEELRQSDRFVDQFMPSAESKS
ncbi:MAG: AAA family ATPase [Aestuariivita sp.]|nr:AAA family ATPase [Aestuariivita sp.]